MLILWWIVKALLNHDWMKNLVLCGMLVVAFACSAPETEQIAEPQTNSEQESVVDAIMLTSSQARLANISLSSVGSATHSMRTPISGRLMVNPERSTVVSSRVAGRIERLFVKQTGQRITLGQPLYTIYSEELLVLQREYLMAKEQHDRTVVVVWADTAADPGSFKAAA
jgi:multidrug efflux pump subunit AcrA (membrane-fusion protein)